MNGAVTAPAPSCCSNSAARAMATAGAVMSAPRSKRIDASVRSPSLRLVARTDCGLNHAASNTMRVVARRDFGVAAAHHAANRLGPFGVGNHEHVVGETCAPGCPGCVIRSPARARRTTIAGPARRAWSNACIGWPSSSST